MSKVVPWMFLAVLFVVIVMRPAETLDSIRWLGTFARDVTVEMGNFVLRHV